MKKDMQIEERNMELKNPKHIKEKLDPDDTVAHVKKDENIEEIPKDLDLLTLEDIRENIKHIEKSVNTKEPRFLLRALRTLVTLRKRLNANVIRRIVNAYVQSSQKEALLKLIPEPMETGAVNNFKVRSASSQALIVEVSVYLNLLVVIYLLDSNMNKEALICSDDLMAKILSQNRRTMDALAAKCYFYHSHCYEVNGKFDQVRSFLITRLRTCTLHNDYSGMATLTNLLLRNYLHYALYHPADKLVTKSTFPDKASNNEYARYLYYTGRIKAIQLEYSQSHVKLTQAMRKAPQNSAIGFKQTSQKLAVVVELLMGDIPDRSIFRQTIMRKTLAPYLQLTQAVRAGSLSNFSEVLNAYGNKFLADGTHSLIVRLRHNVIKTGIRCIGMAYARLSLKDVAQKLSVESPEDAEFIIAKAIRDGVIHANINHEEGFVYSKEHTDVYSTGEPLTNFHQRITFCLDIHNESVKAMRFPPKSYNKDLESAEERREREQQEFESAKEMADEDYDCV